RRRRGWCSGSMIPRSPRLRAGRPRRARRVLAPSVPLRALALGKHPLEVGGLGGAALVLMLLVRGQRGVDRLVLLGRPLVLDPEQLLRRRFALRLIQGCSEPSEEQPVLWRSVPGDP